MGEALTITDMPGDLKRFWTDEAKRNARSTDEEIIRVLGAERARRETAAAVAKNWAEIIEAARRLQSLPVLDNRSLEDILYDSDGMPK